TGRVVAGHDVVGLALGVGRVVGRDAGVVLVVVAGDRVAVTVHGVAGRRGLVGGRALNRRRRRERVVVDDVVDVRLRARGERGAGDLLDRGVVEDGGLDLGAAHVREPGGGHRGLRVGVEDLAGFAVAHEVDDPVEQGGGHFRDPSSDSWVVVPGWSRWRE